MVARCHRLGTRSLRQEAHRLRLSFLSKGANLGKLGHAHDGARVVCTGALVRPRTCTLTHWGLENSHSTRPRLHWDPRSPCASIAFDTLSAVIIPLAAALLLVPRGRRPPPRRGRRPRHTPVRALGALATALGALATTLGALATALGALATTRARWAWRARCGEHRVRVLQRAVRASDPRRRAPAPSSPAPSSPAPLSPAAAARLEGVD